MTMKHLLKTACSFFLSCALFLNIMSPAAFAMSNPNPCTKDLIIANLVELGFTPQEIDELFIMYPYDESKPLFGQDSNQNSLKSSKPDQVETYYISTAIVEGYGYAVTIGELGLGLTEASWKKIIVKAIGWKITLLTGAIALCASSMLMGPTGLELIVTYRWTYGDNSMEWSYLPLSFEANKY